MPKRNPESDFTLDNPSSNLSPSVSPNPTITKKRIGIYVPINEDGQLDASRVRNSNDLERVRAALAIKAPEPPKPITVNRAFMPQAYSMLEVVIQRLGGFFLKWPKELQTEMYFEEEDKKNLTEPTAAVLEKYGPKWFIENQEVAALVAAFSTAINNMVLHGSERYVTKITARAINSQPTPAQPTNGAVAIPAQ